MGGIWAVIRSNKWKCVTLIIVYLAKTNLIELQIHIFALLICYEHISKIIKKPLNPEIKQSSSHDNILSKSVTFHLTGELTAPGTVVLLASLSKDRLSRDLLITLKIHTHTRLTLELRNAIRSVSLPLSDISPHTFKC